MRPTSGEADIMYQCSGSISLYRHSHCRYFNEGCEVEMRCIGITSFCCTNEHHDSRKILQSKNCQDRLDRKRQSGLGVCRLNYTKSIKRTIWYQAAAWTSICRIPCHRGVQHQITLPPTWLTVQCIDCCVGQPGMHFQQASKMGTTRQPTTMWRVAMPFHIMQSQDAPAARFLRIRTASRHVSAVRKLRTGRLASVSS